MLVGRRKWRICWNWVTYAVVFLYAAVVRAAFVDFVVFLVFWEEFVVFCIYISFVFWKRRRSCGEVFRSLNGGSIEFRFVEV